MSQISSASGEIYDMLSPSNHGASIPPLDASQHQQSGQEMDVPSRPMQIKVLYSIDGRHTCLARIRDPIDVGVFALSPTLELGFLSLSQCIQAMLNNSPEISAHLRQQQHD